ncbi:MAG: alpha/beta hydrolase [Nevskia sp.]|nr:alpha/beta hydrolase [Nevskia sp.]
MPFAAVNGTRLFYADDGAGTPLLLVHGIGTDHEDWEDQVPVFARRYRVIAPDLRGYGRSDRGGEFSPQAFAADLWALLDGLGIGRFLLVGHSMGGAVALQMAVDQPERVLALVAADTLPSFVIDTPAKRLLFAFRYVMMSLFGPRRLARAVANKLFPEPGQAALRERSCRRGAAIDRHVYLKNLRQLVGWSVQRRLERLRMPVLVIAAEHDYFPVGDAEAFTAALPDGRLSVFAGRHHALPLEAPRRFNATVLRFFAAAASGRGDALSRQSASTGRPHAGAW